MNALVRFSQVEKRFNGVVAVAPMDLEIPRGEFLAIMGSSGCGKTTTLRMLAGLETPTSGEIYLDGERVDTLRPEERETPMVWQSLALFPFLDVVNNVEFGLRMRDVPAPERRERAMRWLERMEIAHLSGRMIDQLSGGQRQRVALARALVTEPRILLLDEPLSALDANLVVRMQGVLSNLQRDLGITFVYVTHSQSEAFAMADRIIIMNNGKVEQIGTPQELYKKPASSFVARFIGSNNLLDGEVAATDAGRITVSAGDVSLESTSDDVWRVGDAVTAVISADRMEITDVLSDQPMVNVMQGELISESFTGSLITLLIETSAGEVRVQARQRDFGEMVLTPGKRLQLNWSVDDVYLLPR